MLGSLYNSDAIEALKSIWPTDSKPGHRVFAKLRRLEGFKADLEAAGIPFLNELGERADFHSLRHTLDTVMGCNGVSDAMRMSVMRHSDPKLTANTYTYAAHLPKTQTVSALPSVWPSSESTAAYLVTQSARISAQAEGVQGQTLSQADAEGAGNSPSELPQNEGLRRNLAHAVAPGREEKDSDTRIRT